MTNIVKSRFSCKSRQNPPNPVKCLQIPPHPAKSRRLNLRPNPIGIAVLQGARTVKSRPLPLWKCLCDFKEIHKREGIWTQPPLVNPVLGSTNVHILGPQSEECQKPQSPLLLKKVSQIHLPFVLQHASNFYRSALVPLRSKERGILSVLLPFVSQYASHLYCNTPPICIAILLGKAWWMWSPECSSHRPNCPKPLPVFPVFG